jgi:hypothetical protein
MKFDFSQYLMMVLLDCAIKAACINKVTQYPNSKMLFLNTENLETTLCKFFIKQVLRPLSNLKYGL